MASNEDLRARLGIWLVVGSAAALVVLAIAVMIGAVIQGGTDPASVYKAAQLLLASLLPMFGTWVGTVLAFYYTRENYEAASRGTLDLVRTVAQNLSSTPVTSKMMPRSQIIATTVPPSGKPDDILIAGVEALFNKLGANGQRISRLLILDSAGVCLGILHRSIFMEAKTHALADNPPVDMSKDTLGKMLARPCPLSQTGTYLDFVQSTLAYVAQDRTLADAKAAMEQIPGCQDVIVTRNGARSEVLLGWLSNIDIGRMSQA